MKTQNRLLNAAFVFSVVLLTACGGGGGGGAGSSLPPPPPPPPPPPVNSAPTVASANANQTATVGVAFSYDATQAGTTFNDADNDTLTYRVSFSPDSNGFTASNGQLSGTPQDAETTTVTITADDGNGGTVDDVFTIDTIESNSAPTVASANADQTATVGEAFSYDATQAGATFNDADNDTLTYRVSFSPDSNGFTASNGQISGTPQDAETTTVTITADDGNGGTVDNVFTISSTFPESFDLLDGDSSRGITYAAGRLYVVGAFNRTVYSYQTSGQRDSASDFNPDSDNSQPEGITFANGRFYVVDSNSGRDIEKVFAYQVSGQRESDFDFTLLNSWPGGITFANDRFYVVDRIDLKVYAYGGVLGQRDDAFDFDLDSDNGDAQGIAFANDRFYVVDNIDDKVYVYDASGQRDSASDFNLDSDNDDAQGIAYSNDRFYVVDDSGGKVYVYDGPTRSGGNGSDTLPSFGAATIDDQTYDADSTINPFTLPVASGGNGTLTYSLAPSVAGLTFNATTRQLTGTPSTAGTYAMIYTVTDEDGDTDTLRFTITVREAVSGSPDLVVQSPSVSDASPEPGASITLSATVRNQGAGQAAATTLRYYRSTNSTISTSDTQVGTDEVGALAASSTSNQSISLTAPSTAGTYYYGACVTRVSGESNSQNNCSSAVTITVSSSGGGAAVAAKVTGCSIVRLSGSTVLVTIRGTVTAHRSVSSVFISGTFNGQSFAGGFRRPLGSISAGRSVNFTMVGTVNNFFGTSGLCEVLVESIERP